MESRYVLALSALAGAASGTLAAWLLYRSVTEPADDEEGEESPWPTVESDMFTPIRAWAACDNPRDALDACREMVHRLNAVPAAHWTHLFESGRVTAALIARYLSERNQAPVTRDELLAEIERLELLYMEENILAEHGGASE